MPVQICEVRGGYERCLTHSVGRRRENTYYVDVDPRNYRSPHRIQHFGVLKGKEGRGSEVKAERSFCVR